jgi:hypothetical protein
MAGELDALVALKTKVEKIRRDADRASGAYDQGLAQLKKDFGCTTLEEAQKLLEKLKKDTELSRQNYQTALKTFEAKWGDKLCV